MTTDKWEELCTIGSPVSYRFDTVEATSVPLNHVIPSALELPIWPSHGQRLTTMEAEWDITSFNLHCAEGFPIQPSRFQLTDCS